MLRRRRSMQRPDYAVYVCVTGGKGSRANQHMKRAQRARGCNPAVCVREREGTLKTEHLPLAMEHEDRLTTRTPADRDILFKWSTEYFPRTWGLILSQYFPSRRGTTRGPNSGGGTARMEEEEGHDHQLEGSRNSGSSSIMICMGNCWPWWACRPCSSLQLRWTRRCLSRKHHGHGLFMGQASRSLSFFTDPKQKNEAVEIVELGVLV